MNSFEQAFDPVTINALIHQVREPLLVIKDRNHNRYGIVLATAENERALLEHEIKIVFTVPALYPEYLGNYAFNKVHQVRFPYVVGEMAHGIATAEMVIAANKAGLLGAFGSAGLLPDLIKDNIYKIRAGLGEGVDNWASNLIYNPHEPELERRIINLYLEEHVTNISASAYMQLSPHIVHYAFKGIKRTQDGVVVRQNHVLAKLSRPELAELFMAPPPAQILRLLREQGSLTEEEVVLASTLPVAEDITVEADSGGHTDNRPLSVLFPVIKQLSIHLKEKFNYEEDIRLGAAGGLGTPDALAAAFSMGADYVQTGSINQCAVEAGVCQEAKEMLAKADITDIEMAPAADMFELGVRVQVLKKGTLFSRRAAKLYQYFLKYNSLDEIPQVEKDELEKVFFRQNIEETWASTKEYFSGHDPQQLKLAQESEKYRMALVFRAYLGKTSRWAIVGDKSRNLDYQLWCGPSMGAFNRWVKGTFLDELCERTVQQMAYNLLEGAAIITRAHQLRSMGVLVPKEAFFFSPRLFVKT